MNRTHENCVEILNQLVESGYTNQVSKRILDIAITMKRGGDPRTLKNWTANLERLGFISRMNASVFTMDLKKAPGLLNVAVRTGQKRLL